MPLFSDVLEHVLSEKAGRAINLRATASFVLSLKLHKCWRLQSLGKEATPPWNGLAFAVQNTPLHDGPSN